MRFPKLTAALCGVLALFVLGAGKKISDYTETLELGDAWIYEIAVPGVTNYKVTFGTIATNIIARVPGGGGNLVTNANQFGASGTLTLKNGLMVTNGMFYGTTTNQGNLYLMGVAGTGYRELNANADGLLSIATPRTSVNLVQNGSFEVWDNGVGPSSTAAPSKWRIGGNESFQRNATNRLFGAYCVRFANTGGSGIIGEIYQNIALLTNEWNQGGSWNIGYWNGKTVTFSCWVFATNANRVKAVLNDDVTQSFSSYHTGTGGWQLLSVTKTMSPVSTAFQVGVFIEAGADTIFADLDGAMLTEGQSTSSFSDAPLVIGDNMGSDPALPITTTFNGPVMAGGLSLSSTGVSHGITAYASNSTYGFLGSISTTDGGLKMFAISDYDANAFQLYGIIGSTNPTDTLPAILLSGSKKSTNGGQVLGNLETVLKVDNWDTSIMTILGSGYLGLGTVFPSASLDVTGQVRAASAIFTNSLTVNGVSITGSGSGGGTNFPPVTTTGTNITVGTGVRKSLLMPTNASAGISFNGTEILGENVTLVVTNTSANASNITISVFQDGVAASYFDSTVASNVTGFLVVSNSSKRMEFVYNGSFWRLESTIAKEMELSVAGGLSLTTNSVTSIVTLSNSLAIQQLNNVGIGTPAAGDVLSWSVPMSKWTNTVVPGGDVISNITVSATNNVLLDFAAANIFKLTLLTNWTHTFTNATSLTKKGYVYFQQDTNGNRMLNNYSVSGGLLQTNASENMQPTTNANALDLLELMPGFFTTNLIAYWPQDFQPRIKFTNSLHAFLSFIDTFNRANADPMSTTASDGHSWTSGPGALAEPRIVSSMLFGNAGQTGCRVLTPAMGGNQMASLTLLGNVGSLGPMVHIQSTVDASGYFLVADDSTHLAIYKLTDTGSLATLVLFTSAATPTMVAGDTITLTINGITLECFLNGVSYGTVDDATFSGGQPGIWMNSDSASGGPFTASEQ